MSKLNFGLPENRLQLRVHRAVSYSEKPYIAAILTADPRASVFKITHEPDMRESRDFPVEVRNGLLFIQTDFDDQLGYVLLFPILFPELSADTTALRDLQL